MKKYLLIFFVLTNIFGFAQSFFMGKTIDENGKEIPGIYVINVTSGQNTYTDSRGEFSLNVKIGDLVRLVSKNYERIDKNISLDDLTKNFVVKLTPRVQDIEEVKLKYVPTGDLSYDLAHLPTNKRDKELNNKIKGAIAMGMPDITLPHLSTPSAFTSQRNLNGNSFGINVFKGKKKKEDPPLMMSDYAGMIRTAVGSEFFTELGIPDDRVMDFVRYTIVQGSNERIDFDLRQRNISRLKQMLTENASDFLATITK